MNTIATGIVALVIIVALAALIAAGVFLVRRRQSAERSADLQRRFGPEYDRTVAERGSRDDAERDLAARQGERSRLQIRDLDPERRELYAGRWRVIQAHFVDEPVQSVAEADNLVSALMAERGYPVDDFERRTATVSVDYPDVAQDYRTAHRISTASNEGRANTEECRAALVHYRALFVNLLGPDQAAGRQAADRSVEQPRDRTREQTTGRPMDQTRERTSDRTIDETGDQPRERTGDQTQGWQPPRRDRR
jgi:hypothetical protein